MTHLNTPNRSTSRQAAAESGRTTFGVPIPMSITLPPARAAYRRQERAIYASVLLISRQPGTPGRTASGGVGSERKKGKGG